jgi:drug/metabolite transporter (DMT)-like permease
MNTLAAPSTPVAAKWIMPPALQGTLWGGAAVTIWGLYLAFARANVSQGILPADLALIRFVTAGLIMLPWLSRHRQAVRRETEWSKAAILTLLAGPLFILVGASGFKFAPLSHGSVIQPGTITIAGLMLGAVLLGDALTRARMIGAAVIVSGLALVAGPSALHGGPTSLIGDSLFAAAGLMWALFAVLSRRWSVSPLTATAVVSVLSAAVYTPFFLATRGISALSALPVDTLFQLIVLHGVLSGVVAVFAFGRAVELLGAPRAAAFPALVPVIATLAGIAIIGEVPSLTQLAGLLITTLGLCVTQMRSSKRIQTSG